jgi:hypothetical protein
MTFITNPKNGMGTQCFPLYGGGKFSFYMPSTRIFHVVANALPIFPSFDMSVGSSSTPFLVFPFGRGHILVFVSSLGRRYFLTFILPMGRNTFTRMRNPMSGGLPLFV